MTELLIKNILSEILFENKICESLQDQHVVNYLYKELLLERILIGEPLTIEELRKLLHNKIVNFEFIKLDGEIRPAKGTTLMKYVPQSDHPKGIRHSSPKVATFYDLDKMDWRSVSQDSKEIVLKRDEVTQKPVVAVKDKPEDGDVAVQSEEPIGTIDGKPAEEPVTTEPSFEPKPTEVSKIKPIEKGENVKTFYFVNPVTGASMTMDMPSKDMIKKLKELGRDWKLETENEYKRREEDLESKASKEEEPEEIKKPILKTNSEPESIIDKEEEDLDNIDANLL